MRVEDHEALFEQLEEAVKERESQRKLVLAYLNDVELRINTIGPKVSAHAYLFPHEQRKSGLSYIFSEGKGELRMYGRPLSEVTAEQLAAAAKMVPRLLKHLIDKAKNGADDLRLLLASKE